jgi:2-amino-4-hydroxy-6-hydroxymethyldihydropteridine diphosphokinase
VPIAYLSLGSNIGDRAGNLAYARRRLHERGAALRALSGVEETDPVGMTEQRRFLNQVVKVETQLEPRELLTVAKEIEAEAGRQPGGPRWGPRELDIDIVVYEAITMDEPDLTIPHPRAAERDFVLRELAEIDPVLADSLRKPQSR